MIIGSSSPDITRRSLSGQCAEISHPAMGYLCWPGGWLTSDLPSQPSGRTAMALLPSGNLVTEAGSIRSIQR